MQPKRSIQIIIRTGFMLLCCFCFLKGRAQQSPIHIDLSNTNLLKVINQLQQQTPGINFSFQPSTFEKIMVEKVVIKAVSLEEALLQLKKQFGIEYLVDGKTVALKYISKEPAAEKNGSRPRLPQRAGRRL